LIPGRLHDSSLNVTPKPPAFGQCSETKVAECQRLPAWRAIVFQVAAECGDGEHGVVDGWGWRQAQTTPCAEHRKLVFIEHRGSRRIGSFTGFAPEEQQPPRNRYEERERVGQRMEIAKLPLLQCAASFQRFEVLLDSPTRAIPIHDAQDLFGCVDRLGRVEQPLDRRFSFRRCGLPNAHYIERQHVRVCLARTGGARDRDLASSKRKRCCSVFSRRVDLALLRSLFLGRPARQANLSLSHECDGIQGVTKATRFDKVSVVLNADHKSAVDARQQIQHLVIVSLAIHEVDHARRRQAECVHGSNVLGPSILQPPVRRLHLHVVARSEHTQRRARSVCAHRQGAVGEKLLLVPLHGHQAVSITVGREGDDRRIVDD
jgi:hypothetical protein